MKKIARIKICTLWLLWLASFPACGSADEGSWQQSLDGAWQFATNAASARWDTLVVPGNWDAQPAYSTYIGKGWYRREFIVPEAWAGKHIRLHFDAVYHDAIVTVNGQNIGTHAFGYTPFEFEVTDRLKLGQTNVVVICADNTYRRGAWWHWGGISRSVRLVAYNDARIVWQHINADPDLAAGTANISVQYKLVNDSSNPVGISLASCIDDSNRPALATNAIMAAGEEKIIKLQTALPKASVRLWDFDHPNLYRLTTTLTSNAEIIAQHSDRFGIRKIEMTPAGLLLNGEHVRLPGFNRISDSPATGNAEPDGLVHQDVDLMKSCGAVMSRLMHVPQAPNLLDYLDERGMLIFEEIPVWQDDPQMHQNNPVTKQWLTEMINRDYNHPCIIGWSVGNELPVGRYAYVDSMIGFVKAALDSHRLLTYASCSADNAGESSKTEPIDQCDLALVNLYQANFLADGRAVSSSAESLNLGRRIKIIHERWPDKPVFLSECGVTQIGPDPKATIPGWEQTWADISQNPYVIGAALWTFNDYHSDAKGTDASGNRTWGVVDVTRRPKAAYWQVRKLFSPVHALELDGKIVTLIPRRSSEIPSYAIRGYQIRWTARDRSGTTLQRGLTNVPDLKPDSPSWRVEIPAPPMTAELEVNLLTPTGYDVADGKGPL